jgi:hypothetical protein
LKFGWLRRSIGWLKAIAGCHVKWIGLSALGAAKWRIFAKKGLSEALGERPGGPAACLVSLETEEGKKTLWRLAINAL